MKSKAMAVKDLLNSAIHNQIAQSAMGAGAAYLGARAMNHISPVDIDPEAAMVAGAFGAPMLMRRRMPAPTDVIPDPWEGSYRSRQTIPKPQNTNGRMPPMEWA